MKQRTIQDSIEIVGIGLHKGLPVNIRLEPLEANMGIIFYRSDELFAFLSNELNYYQS